MIRTGAAQLAGVIGWPIAHSLSPLMHNHWIDALGLDAAYVPLKVAPEDFAVVVRSLRAAGFKGLNVTVPHKEQAFALADRVDEAARIAGAANLLLFGEDGIHAGNTDQLGLIAALAEAMDPSRLAGAKVCIWGSGGMARAAVCAMDSMGVSEIVLVARQPARANAMAAMLAKSLRARILVQDFECWNSAADGAALLINATSAGMNGLPPIDLSPECLPQDAAVFDAVYHPLETALLHQARKSGRLGIDGLGMLLHQAVPSFAGFFGSTPAVTPALREIMVRALDAA